MHFNDKKCKIMHYVESDKKHLTRQAATPGRLSQKLEIDNERII